MSGYSNSSYSIGGQKNQAEREEAERENALNARALELAKAHHTAMGPAMRDHMPGQHGGTVVGDWHAMPKPRRDTMVAVMRKLLDDGVIA